ncbi:MAG TPA: aldehyde dehydrogenase family protein [bacterium]|nr:aldehyde dehydrogenase family protein [bacterium]
MSKDKKFIESINPATLEKIAEIETVTAADVPGVVQKAKAVQKSWGRLSPGQRNVYFRRMKEYVAGNLDDICRRVTIDNGKTLLESLSAEVMPVMDMLDFCIREAPQALKSEKITSPMFKLGRIKSSIEFEPLGVVAIIAPWNFPLCIPVTQTLMALAAGNAVVLKPAALTAYTGQLISEIFSKSGFPEGLVNVIQGSGSVLGDAIIAAGVDRIAFTGSVPVGKQLMTQAGSSLIPVTLELGGKDPFIVLDDADIDRASSGAVWGSFINAGQVCASVERVYVHKKVAKEFIRQVREKASALRVGNGLEHAVDMGPLIEERQLEIVQSHIDDAVSRGAEVLVGGGRVEGVKGHFFKPTVLTDVDHSMTCMTEETFGPTMPIMVFSSVDEAVELANDSRFALTASVWSRDVPKARGIANDIVTGTATVNDCEFTYGFAQCPWGGPKESGIGRTHSVHGLYEFTNLKNICVTTPMLRNNIWWYPYSERKYKSLKTFVNTMYSDGLLSKCMGAADLVKKAMTL